MVTSPLSSGCRRASITSVRSSGNSSRSSTPQWARLTSPGRTRPVPPPTMLALLASWWGAENGGRAISRSPSSSAPASEWRAVTSIDSSIVRSGRIEGIRSARVVLPQPLGPLSSRWWPPAAATSAAKRASARPSTSTMSTSSSRCWPRHESRWLPDMGATGGASGTSSPVSSARTWPSDRTPSTSMSGTRAASCACGSGTKIRRIPLRAAARVMGRTPGTDLRLPPRVSSPMNTDPSTSAVGSWWSALSTANAIARSKWVPPLGRSDGDSRMVTRLLVGHGRLVLWTAIWQRDGAWWRETSHRPTMVSPAWPGETSAWTSTRWPTAPSRAMVGVVAMDISRSPVRAPRAPGPGAGAARRRGRPGSPVAGRHAPPPTARRASAAARAWRR